MTFKDKLKKYRNERNMTQKELADKASVSRTALASWEQGYRSPRMEAVFRIADVLKVDVKELLDDDHFDMMVVTRDSEDILINSYRQLNNEGKNMLVAFAQSLVYNPLYGPGEGSMKEAMLYDGAKNQKTIEEMTAEELRRLADEKES